MYLLLNCGQINGILFAFAETLRSGLFRHINFQFFSRKNWIAAFFLDFSLSFIRFWKKFDILRKNLTWN